MKEKKLREVIYTPKEFLEKLGIKGKFRESMPIYQPFDDIEGGIATEEGTIIGIRILIEEI